MTALGVELREGQRLTRSSPARTAMVAIPVTVAATIGAFASASSTSGGFVAVPCVALALVVVVVARRSPNPIRVVAAAAWRRAGATARQTWAVGGFESLTVAGVPAVIATAVGGLLAATMNDDFSAARLTRFALGLLITLVLASFVPTLQPRPPAPRSARARISLAAANVLRVAYVVFALVTARMLAESVRTGFELAVVGFMIFVLLIPALVIVARPLTNLLVAAMEMTPWLRSVSAVVRRYRAPGVVRLVIVSSVMVCVATAVLGASVGARPETTLAVAEQMDNRPVLPRNVALLRLNPLPSSRLVESANPFDRAAYDATKLDTDLLRRLEAIAPGTEVVPLREVARGENYPQCFFTCAYGSVVLEDARLAAITDGTLHPSTSYPVTDRNFGEVGDLATRTRIPTRKQLAERIVDGGALPDASFDGIDLDEATASDLQRLGLTTRVRGAFVVAPEPLTPAQL